MLSLLLFAFFKLWFYFKTPSKNDYFLVKESTFYPHHYLSLSQQCGLNFERFQRSDFDPSKAERMATFILAEGRLHQDSQFIFTVFIAILSISLEMILARKQKMIKRNNRSLMINNKVMIRQNEDLQQTLAVLEESRKEDSRMFQVIAHDLRSPVAAIVGLSAFMIDEQKLAAEDMEVIDLIHTSGIDSLKFINEILDGESNLLEMKKEVIDLHSLLLYCIEQLKYKAIEKNQQIKLESHTSIQLKLNREKIWRVINNLITNALKFSPPQGIITIDLNMIKEMAMISIKDPGIGIPEHLADKIFGLSAERKREGTAGEKSFGMGLAIARQNIEAHGGTLSFVSEVGKGTTFFIALPLEV